jgi:hypothetical protein
MEQIKEGNDALSWSLFIGCMFIGMGIGELFNQAGVGMFIGMGVGYIAEAIIESNKKE